MFNNREIATAIWLAILVAWIATKPDLRTSIAGVFRAFLNWKILVGVASMVLYTTTIVAVLHAMGFWQFAMIKETAHWICFAAFVMVMRFSTSRDDENILRTVIVDNVKLIIVLEFLVGTYVMPLPAELAFVPIVTLLAILDAVGKLDEKNAIVAKFTTRLLAVIGFAIICFAISRAIGDFRNLGTMDTIRAIAFPPLMSIAFVPFIYDLVVIITYESIFIRLAIGRDKSRDVVRYVKRRIFVHCGVSLRRLRAFRKRPPFEIVQVESAADVDRLFTSA